MIDINSVRDYSSTPKSIIRNYQQVSSVLGEKFSANSWNVAKAYSTLEELEKSYVWECAQIEFHNQYKIWNIGLAPKPISLTVERGIVDDEEFERGCVYYCPVLTMEHFPGMTVDVALKKKLLTFFEARSVIKAMEIRMKAKGLSHEDWGFNNAMVSFHEDGSIQSLRVIDCEYLEKCPEVPLQVNIDKLRDTVCYSPYTKRSEPYNMDIIENDSFYNENYNIAFSS